MFQVIPLDPVEIWLCLKLLDCFSILLMSYNVSVDADLCKILKNITFDAVSCIFS